MLDFQNDPGVFSYVQNISSEIVDYFFKLGPSQPSAYEMPNKCFPKDPLGRSFHDNWYWKQLPSGERVRRKWMTYSISENKLYCFHCALFGKNLKTNWSREGFCNWKNGIPKIIVHETSEAHIMSSIKAAYRETAFPILPSLEEKKNLDKALNKEIVRHLIDITLYLGRHCLPFRGHKERWNEKLMGNFKDLAVLLANYSPALSSYITQVQLKGKKIHNFLSWQRQNQLIQSIFMHIKDTIQKELLEARFFSVSLDTTFDVSKKEQLSVILRYINKNTTDCTVNERLVAVRETAITTGQHLFTILEEILNEMNIDWKNHLIGQSYDGAASMRCVYNGLQAIVKEHNPCATYVWCYAHRLNLIIVDAVSSCPEARDLFGNLEVLYDFIGSSKKRVNVYSNYQKERYPNKPLRRLKRVETTRWSSHSAALQTVFETFNAILDTLEYLEKDNYTDRISGIKAKRLFDYILSERFFLTGFTFKQIFDLTSPLNSYLQGKNIDLLTAVSYVKKVQQKIKLLRSDVQFEAIMKEKEIFVNSKIDFDLSPFAQIRTRKKKKMSGEILSDELPNVSPINNFKINTYFVVIDIVSSQISERFNEFSSPLMVDLELFKKKRVIEINKLSNLPNDAFNGFQKVYGKFVSSEDLRKEYVQFANVYLELEKTLTLSKVLHKQNNVDFTSCMYESGTNNEEDLDDIEKIDNSDGTIHMMYKMCNETGLKDTFPALYTALSIALTLPISSASPERAFSKLKLVKTRLRSTMCEDRLEALMVMSCESDIPIDPDNIINRMASYSTNLSKLL